MAVWSTRRGCMRPALLALAVLLLVRPSSSIDYKLEPWMFLSSKTPYWPAAVGTYETMPRHCKLVHINHLGRHGSRHSNKLSDAMRLKAVLQSALDEDGLTEQGALALDWIDDYIEVESGLLGQLTEAGRLEHENTARRLLEKHGAGLVESVRDGRPLILESTDSPRTKGSRDGFAEGLRRTYNKLVQPEERLAEPLHTANPANRSGIVIVEEQTCKHAGMGTAARSSRAAAVAAAARSTSVTSSGRAVPQHPNHPRQQLQPGQQDQVQVPPPAPTTPVPSYAAYAKLRFFDVCKAFVQYKESKPWMPRLTPYTANASLPTSHESRFLSQLFTPAMLEELSMLSASDWKKTQKAKERLAAEAGPAGILQAQQKRIRKFELAWGKGGGGKDGKDGKGQQQPSRRKLERQAGRWSGKQQEDEEAEEGMQLGASASPSPSAGATSKRLKPVKADKDKAPSVPLLAKLAGDIYTVCQIEGNALGRTDRFCSLFAPSAGNARSSVGHHRGHHKHGHGHGHGVSSSGSSGSTNGASEGHMSLMAKNELLRDLGDFYKQGAGEPVAFAPACLLLEDFITAGEAGAGLAGEEEGKGQGQGVLRQTAADRAASRLSAPAAHFRFGHSETVMPLLSVLGLYQDPSAPTLEEYYHSELAKGTKHLLNATRARLQYLRERHGLAEVGAVMTEADGDAVEAADGGKGELEHGHGKGGSSKGKGSKKGGHSHSSKGEGGAGVAESSSSAEPHPSCSSSSKGSKKGGKGCRDKEGKGGSGSSLDSTFTTVPSPHERSLPAGFNEPLLLALKHPWSGARLSPMAANIQWLMYDCGDEQEENGEGQEASTGPRMHGMWVKMLHNEREVGFPACGLPGGSANSRSAAATLHNQDPTLLEHALPVNEAAAPYGLSYPCPWGVVKEYYRRTVYSRYGIQSCSPSEWQDWCGGLEEEHCDAPGGVGGGPLAEGGDRRVSSS